MQILASVPNLDNASGHKAIKIKKLIYLFKLNSIKANLKQTTTVANYWPAIAKVAKYEIQKPSTNVAHEQICCMTSCMFDEKRATKIKICCL